MLAVAGNLKKKCWLYCLKNIDFVQELGYTVTLYVSFFLFFIPFCVPWGKKHNIV